jgi:hypothetical protein
MAFYNNRIGKKIDSVAMKAVSRDSISDCCSTLAVLLSLIVTTLTRVKTDGWFGLLVSLFVLYTGYKSTKDTISPLLGQPPEKELVQRIQETVLSYPEIVGLHDLIVHDYGPGRQMISLHAEVSRDSEYRDHEVIDNARRAFLQNRLSGGHSYGPIRETAERCAENIIGGLVKQIDTRVTIHDFRIVEGRTHTNVIFDIVVPYDVKKSESELIEEVSHIISEYDSTLNAVVEVDRAYV